MGTEEETGTVVPTVELVARLRREAGELRDCFTQFSFKAMTLAATGLALIFASTGKLDLVDLAVVPLIGLLATVSRIGIYKYTASNRLLGYELHLHRTDEMRDVEIGWQRRYRHIDWEAALRAWRVIQPALFRRVYVTPEEWPPNRSLREVLTKPPLRWLHQRAPWLYGHTKPVKELEESRRKKMPSSGYLWFHLPSITKPPPDSSPGPAQRHNLSAPLYHAGSYLHYMLQILFLMQILLLLPIVFAAWAGFRGDEALESWLRIGLLIVLVVTISISAININKRRRMIEEGLLSIHSTAITWQAVVLAHYRALAESDDPAMEYRHYTERLVLQACGLAESLFQIHEWIASPDDARNGQLYQPSAENSALPRDRAS